MTSSLPTSSPTAATLEQGGLGVDSPAGLSTEERLLAFFVRLAQALGLPRSLGQIYGTLFCASAPLSFEELTFRSGVSKGAVSQGVRTLVGFRAVRSSTRPHDRRTYFQAEPSMKQLASNLLSESVQPFIRQSEDELQTIAAGLAADEGEPFSTSLAAKVQFLLHWHAELRKLLPLLAALVAPVSASETTPSAPQPAPAG